MKVQCARLSVAVSLCVVTAGCGEGVPPETPAGEGEDIGSASAALTGPILGDFEDGTLQRFSPRGAGLVLTNTTETAFTGTHSLKTTRRTAGFLGPGMNLTNQLTQGACYHVT